MPTIIPSSGSQIQDWIDSFAEYDTDECIVCHAYYGADTFPAYLGTVENGRWIENFGTIFPFCHALCMQEALLRGFRPCTECDGTGNYHFTYLAYGEYESDSIDCPVCPNSKGYFEADDPERTLDDVIAEDRAREMDDLYASDQ